MEEMQGENTENPYGNGTVQPCIFLSACIGQETPGVCPMEIQTELLHGDKTERQKGPAIWQEGVCGWDHRRFKKLVMTMVFMKSMNRLPTRGTTK